jgi:hypothetical protein
LALRPDFAVGLPLSGAERNYARKLCHDAGKTRPVELLEEANGEGKGNARGRENETNESLQSGQAQNFLLFLFINPAIRVGSFR